MYKKFENECKEDKEHSNSLDLKDIPIYESFISCKLLHQMWA